jgi:hypothetical protein
MSEFDRPPPRNLIQARSKDGADEQIVMAAARRNVRDISGDEPWFSDAERGAEVARVVEGVEGVKGVKGVELLKSREEQHLQVHAQAHVYRFGC